MPDATIETLFQQQKSHARQLALSTVQERCSKLEKIIAYLQAELPAFQEALYTDLRRAPADTLAELLMVKTDADFAIRHLSEWTKPHRVKNSLMSQGTKAYYLYEPKGVALILSTWNAPFAISLVPLIGALAAGNAVILKPSELAPHSSTLLKKMIETLFSPAEVAVVEGDAGIAQQLLTLPFDHIYFTGSPMIGKQVMAAAAQHLTSITLELGGKSPTIVDETADLEKTAYKVGWGKCANSGQACIAPDYLFVQESVAQPFLAALKKAVQAMYNPDGQGFQKSPALCRIVNPCHFQRVRALLEDALAKGATLELGGELDEADLYISPTILSHVTNQMRVMQEEIFAPILPVMIYQTADQVVEQIGQRDKPLALYIYSQNAGNIAYFLQRTTAGSTVINHNMIQAGVNPHLPFGGANQSGMGRSVGKATFESFSNQRSIVQQPSGWGDFAWLSFPPYSQLYQKMLQYLFK